MALVGVAIVAIAWWTAPRKAETAPIGLFTTLPILWADSPDLGAQINPEARTHWAADLLARRGKVEPIDVLAGNAGFAPLDRVRRLVLAQPRVLSPQENVALDDWVRGGGHLLLLADPALTEESTFSLGDPRRPQAVVLLSPILNRWGLDLRFDDRQAMGETTREVLGVAVPVNLPGYFAISGQANCQTWADGLAATCTIGKGRVVALADAAVIERSDPDGAKTRALSELLDAAFAAH